MTLAKLRLSDWASIAEVVGAAAVVISLIYVGLQIQENTVEVREANREQLISRAFAATGRVAANPGLAAAFAKVTEGTALTPTESVQYSFFVRSMLYDVQEAFLLYRDERLDKEYWRTRSAIFGSYMKYAVARDVYLRDKELGVLHSEFLVWADQIIASQGRSNSN